MNPEFSRRHRQALKMLSLLAKKAKANKELLVFIGGSAVQATLKKPQRLSIDLDVYYDGVPEKLLAILSPPYRIEKRPSQRDDLFAFYRATHRKTLVKIDMARFKLVEKGRPYATKKLGKGEEKFTANVATPDYLLASKLTALAVNTIGRKPTTEDYQMNFLKDLFDANCLLNEFPPTQKTWKWFTQIIETQNRVRKTNYNLKQVIDSATKAIQDSATQETLKGTLQSFSQYLLRGGLQKPAYWEKAYRLAACLTSFQQTGVRRASMVFTRIERMVGREFANKTTADRWEDNLQRIGAHAGHLHELKILAPRALGYLWAHRCYPFV